ncbi:MAG: alpha/beta fold hydrolase [Candidatus Scalindua sp.]|nr:alpha/beta fold hydrolase [Candidatus Scalindua sp.]
MNILHVNEHNNNRLWKTSFIAIVTKIKRQIIYATLLFVFLLTGSCTITSYFVRQTDLRAPRNSSTGILPGAEERDLGNFNSTGAVLFVHGFAGGSNNFRDLPDRLAKLGWRVRVMRLPGHGTSPFDLEKQTTNKLIQSVRDELMVLKNHHQKIVVVGHSMGCALSSLAVRDVPVDKLVFGSPYFGITYKEYYILPVEVWVSLLDPIIRWVHKGSGSIQVNRKEAKKEIFSYKWLPLKGLKTLVEVGKRAKHKDVLLSIQSPILFFHSSEDRSASPKAALEAFHMVASQDKTLIWVNRSNHHVFWDFDREKVMKEIEEFVGLPGL